MTSSQRRAVGWPRPPRGDKFRLGEDVLGGRLLEDATRCGLLGGWGSGAIDDGEEVLGDERWLRKCRKVES
jgi:hypothetical protein